MIEIEINEDEITAALARVEAALTDMTSLMSMLGEILKASTDRRFIEGQAPDGSIWAPKSATTIATYKRRGDPVSSRPLIGPTKVLSSTIFYEAGPDFVSINSNPIQAAVMQFGAAKGAFGTTARGAPIPWGDIPARPFLGVSDEDRASIADQVSEWLGGVAQHGATGA